MDKTFALVISAIDPINGAGFTLDISLLGAMGIKAMGVPTAILPQSTSGVAYIKELEKSTLMDSLQLIFSTVTPVGMKVSIMGNLMDEIPDICSQINGPRVLDPIISPGGLRILDEKKLNKLREIIPLFDFITPNIPEAREILGVKEMSPERMCEELFRTFHTNVYLKGGHSSSKIDLFCSEAGLLKIPPTKIFPYEVHGTGCFLSSALLGFLINGDPPEQAILNAKKLLVRGYETAIELGGPKRVFSPPEKIYSFERE